MYLLNIFNSSGLRQGEAGCAGSLAFTRILDSGCHLFVMAMFSLGAMNAGGATGNTNWSVDVSTNQPPVRWHFQHCYKHVDDNHAGSYLHGHTGAVVKGTLPSTVPSIGPGSTAWWTSRTNHNGRLLYHFHFPYNTKRVHIQARLGAVYTGCHVGRTTMMLSSVLRPASASDFTQFAQAVGNRGSARVEELVNKEADSALMGTRHLWIAIDFHGIADFSLSTANAARHVFAVKAEYDFECSGGGDHVGKLNTRTGQYSCMKCGMHMPQSMYELIVQNEWAHGGGASCNCEDHPPTAPDRASPSPQRDKAPLPLPRMQPLRRKPFAPARRSSLQIRANSPAQSRQSLRMMRRPMTAVGAVALPGISG